MLDSELREEIEEVLNRVTNRAVVGFGVRVVQRVRPLYSVSGAQAVDSAIAYAVRYSHDDIDKSDADRVYDAQHEAAVVAIQASREAKPIPGNPHTVPELVAKSASSLASAVYSALISGVTVDKVVMVAMWAGAIPYSTESALRADLERLRREFPRLVQGAGNPISEDFWGPLWPDDEHGG